MSAKPAVIAGLALLFLASSILALASPFSAPGVGAKAEALINGAGWIMGPLLLYLAYRLYLEERSE